MALVAAGLVYGVIGVFVLGVALDHALLFGTLVLLGAIPWFTPPVARRSVRADRGERSRRLAGDELIPRPIKALTHAITIHRPRHEVWPWLAQMGAGSRAGWYSYDRLDNAGQPSAARIVPELQGLSIGMVFPAVPGASDGFILLAFQPDEFLVLGWSSPAGVLLVTWAFVLEDAGQGATRLIVRVRGAEGYRFRGLPGWMSQPAVSIVHFVMQRRQLLGVASRVEQGVPDTVSRNGP